MRAWTLPRIQLANLFVVGKVAPATKQEVKTACQPFFETTPFPKTGGIAALLRDAEEATQTQENLL